MLAHSTRNALTSYCSVPAEEMSNINHGGVAILIENTTPHRQIPLTTSLQAITVEPLCTKPSLCVPCIYLHQRNKTVPTFKISFLSYLSGTVLFL